jgi:hypothetical protein
VDTGNKEELEAERAVLVQEAQELMLIFNAIIRRRRSG